MSGKQKPVEKYFINPGGQAGNDRLFAEYVTTSGFRMNVEVAAFTMKHPDRQASILKALNGHEALLGFFKDSDPNCYCGELAKEGGKCFVCQVVEVFGKEIAEW